MPSPGTIVPLSACLNSSFLEHALTLAACYADKGFAAVEKYKKRSVLAHHLVKVLLVDARGEHAPPVQLQQLEEAVGGRLNSRGRQAQDHILCEVADEERDLPQEGCAEHEALGSPKTYSFSADSMTVSLVHEETLYCWMWRKHACRLTCILASLLEKAVRTTARPSRRRMRLPAMGSKKLSSFLRESPDFPFFLLFFALLPITTV